MTIRDQMILVLSEQIASFRAAATMAYELMIPHWTLIGDGSYFVEQLLIQTLNEIQSVIVDDMRQDKGMFGDLDVSIKYLWFMSQMQPSSFKRMVEAARGRGWARIYPRSGDNNVERN